MFNIVGRSEAAQRPAWAQLRVGQRAYLGAFLLTDNDTSRRPICDTYQSLVNTNEPDGTNCPHNRKVGTVVIITQIGSDIKDNPAVAIRSSDGAWTGWVESTTLTPFIPAGTRLVFKKEGEGMPSVYLHEHPATNENSVEFGEATAVLLGEDAPSGDCTLHIRVLTGPHKGLTGWSCDNPNLEGTNVEATSFID